MKKELLCPVCGERLFVYRNPIPTVDIIIRIPGGASPGLSTEGIVLIERRNPPLGWAIPGGFVDYGERVEDAALREAREETGLDVVLEGLLGVYSDPLRDPRQHTLSVVFVARPKDPALLQGGDDARQARVFALGAWPDLVFDHQKILNDYLRAKAKTGCP